MVDKISLSSFSSLSSCNGYVGYGVQSVWSEPSYATICSGASSMLARQFWPSSKCVYMVNDSPLLLVVSLE